MTRPDSLVTSVLEAVAAADGVEPAALEPLYEYVDPEVLERLSDHDGTAWSFTFQYLDHQVTVTHEGQVRVDGVAYAQDTATN